MKLDPCLSPCTKLNLNINPKEKLLEETLGSMLQDTRRCRQGVPKKDADAQEVRPALDKWGLMESSCIAKKIVNQVKSNL